MGGVGSDRPLPIPALGGIPAAILAGGLGTRLRSKVADRPKVLAPIFGRPFLSYLLDHLAEAGIRRVVLLTGYLGEMIRSEFKDHYRGIQLSYSQEPCQLGTAGALRLGLPFYKSDTVLVINGDSFCGADLGGFWNWYCRSDADAALLLVEVPDTKRYGRVVVDDTGRIIQFEEKDDNSAPGWINAGIYLIKRHLIEKIPENGAVSLERELFPRWIGHKFFAYRSKARFLDIGTPEAFATAPEFFQNNQRDA